MHLPFVHEQVGDRVALDLVPPWFVVTGHLLSVVIGLVLLLLADQLARRKPVAWRVAVVPSGLALIAHLVKGPHQIGMAIAALLPTDDLVAAVHETFRTLAPGPARAVAGLSEGGSCAMMLALRHPTVFGTFGDYAGLAGPRSGDTNDVGSTVDDLFGGDRTAFEEHEPAAILAAGRFPGLGGWFEVGSADAQPLAAATRPAPAARAAGIAVCTRTVDGGGHDFST